MPQFPLDDQAASLYRDYQLVNDYQLNEGVFALPVAEEAPSGPEELKAWSPVQIVRAHSAFRVRTVSFDAKKQQAPPVVPKPADTGAFKFLGGNLTLPAPTLTMNLSDFDWRAYGTFVFVEGTISRPEDGYIIGSGPYTLQSQKDNYDAFGGSVPAPSRVGGEPIVGGAIAQAGPDAWVGQLQANQVAFDAPYWINCPSLMAGVFNMNDTMLNAGPAPSGD